MSNHSPRREVETTQHFSELDQHDAKSQLLGPRGYKSQSVDKNAATPDRDQSAHPGEAALFNGYNGDDVRALKGGNTTTLDDGQKPYSKGVPLKGLTLGTIIFELFAVLLSIGFLVLGACVAALEGKPESAWSEKVVQATKIAPSLWPIIFSGILGNAIRALADWKVERGTLLMTLEQLLGSLTLAGSVLTTLRWSIFRASSISLVLLWAFNPLGSQASFRGIYLRPDFGTTNGQVSFYNASVPFVQYPMYQDNGGSLRTRAFYATAVYEYTASTQYVDLSRSEAKAVISLLGGEGSISVQAATDSWGNVKIPHIGYHPDYQSNKPHQWLKTPWSHQLANYSSLIGDRVDGLDRSITGNTSFTTSTSYHSFNCTPWFSLNSTHTYGKSGWSNNDSVVDLWLLKHTGYHYLDLTSYTVYNGDPFGPGAFRDNVIALIHANMSSGPDREIVFVTRDEPTQEFVQLTRCTHRATYVDANVTCIMRGALGRANCGADAVRETPNRPAEPSLFALGLPFMQYFTHWVRQPFFDVLNILNGVNNYAPTIAELYISNPLTAQYDNSTSKYDTRIGDLDIKTFEQRFSLLWNTYWKLAWSAKSLNGGDLKAPYFDPLKAKDIDKGPRIETIQNASSTTVFPLPSVYAIDRAWLSIYFIACGVMFFAAVFSFVMRTLCRAPIILGYVSSLIRDSTYFEDSSRYRNSTEDGLEKSKRLGALRVIVADVGSGRGETGRIAFAPVGRGQDRIRRVEKGRLYD